MDNYHGSCPRCGSHRWVSVSLDEAWTRIPQCVPCGAYHDHYLGPGWKNPDYARHRQQQLAENGDNDE